MQSTFQTGHLHGRFAYKKVVDNDQFLYEICVRGISFDGDVCVILFGCVIVRTTGPICYSSDIWQGRGGGAESCIQMGRTWRVNRVSAWYYRY